MASKRFIQLLLSIAGLTAISIGLGVGISKRNASSLGRNANSAVEVTVNFSEDDDCVDADAVDYAADDVIPHRRLGSGRRVRATVPEWPWEEEVARELAFSMDYSMSISGKSGKSSKSSAGKSGKSKVRLLSCRYWQLYSGYSVA